MFTHKDIETRTIFVINCIEHSRSLRVNGGELLLEEMNEDKMTTLTKFPFQKLLALFVIGHITVTTPLIEKCKKFGVALVVVKPNLRPVFYWSDAAEGNFLLRKRQYALPDNDISIAKSLMKSKFRNQQTALTKTRRKDALTVDAIEKCSAAIQSLDSVEDYDKLMGMEGMISKCFFAAYFQNLDWHGRHPRIKDDIVNVTLDIGYTILFNFVECFLRMYGFDLYVGVYHRLWHQRKSLVCDMVEPFRCIIDHTVLLAFHRRKFSAKDFTLVRHEYMLKQERCCDYYKVFYDALISRKQEIFLFIQRYYRCFMGRKSVREYPIYEFK